MPRRTNPKARLINLFMDLNGAEQKDLIDTFVALQRRKTASLTSTTAGAGVAPRKRTKKPQQQPLPSTEVK